MRKPIQEDNREAPKGLPVFRILCFLPGEKLADLIGSFPGGFVAAAAGRDTDDQVFLGNDTWKIKIAFVLITAHVDGDAKLFADRIDFVVGLVVVGGGDHQICSWNVIWLVFLFLNGEDAFTLHIQKLLVHLRGDDREMVGESGKGTDAAFGNGARAENQNLFIG